MTTEIIEQGTNNVMHDVVDIGSRDCCLVYDEAQTGKIIDEFIASIKDDRANTKRVISANIASTARVQNQNGQVIAACERELRRQNLSDEYREKLIDTMNKAAESTSYACADSREFQNQQLEHSHKQPLKIVMFAVVLTFGSIGGTALLRAVAK